MKSKSSIPIILIIFLMIFGLLIVLSLSLNPSQQEPEVLERDNLEIDLANPSFETFISEEGKFSILMPGKPKPDIIEVNTEVGEIELHSFMISDDNFAYSAIYSDYPEEVTDLSEPSDILDGARDGIVESVRGTLLHETIVSVNGHPGRKISIDIGGTSSVKSEIYLVENRLYQIIVVSANKEEIFLTSVDRFFDSFSLLI